MRLKYPLTRLGTCDTIRTMTGAQRKLFFELCEKLDIDPVEAKDKAKAKYGKAHFVELSHDEISPLIDILQKQFRVNQPSSPKEDFPNDVRIWDRVDRTMFYSTDKTDFSHWEPSVQPDRFHKMHWTGLRDSYNQKLFDFDIIVNVLGHCYIVQWNWKVGAWFGYREADNSSILLSSFGQCQKVGDTYTGIVKKDSKPE